MINPRLLALLICSALAATAGWELGWPEATALGVGGAAAAVVPFLLVGLPASVTVEVEEEVTRVQRHDTAIAHLRITLRRGRKRWLRVTEGGHPRPFATHVLPKGSASRTVSVDIRLDTTRRGHWRVGPFTVIQGDPWGIIRRAVAQTTGGTLIVHPRVHLVRRQVLSSVALGESERSATRRGEEHFFALRDYMLGDEPRMVHWRSSARSGRLVVRQQVASATTGTSLILDCDVTAYCDAGTFDSVFNEDRFEAVVDVAASLAWAQAAVEQVHLFFTDASSKPISVTAGSTARLLDALSSARTVAPVDTRSAGALTAAVAQTRSARVILVTGSPRPQTLDAVRAIARRVPALSLVRVRHSPAASVAGVRTLDVQGPEELR